MSLLGYVYKPLSSPQSIRLLIVQPGSKDDPLACVLEETTLFTHPVYEAISYAWGVVKSDIRICGQEDSRVEIPYSLERALLRFRHQDEPRHLWADSICIDQSNLLERNEQVKRMGKIYSSALSVLIWLGDEDEETQLAYNCIEMLSEIPSRALMQQQISLPGINSPTFNALRNLLARSWFNRAWTYQESALARNDNGEKQAFIFCGPFVVTAWKMFSMSVSSAYLPSILRHSLSLGNFDSPKYLGTRPKNITQRFLDRTSSDTRLLHEIRGIRGTHCSDSRDLVYSILGMDPAGELIEPDYAKSVEDVFSEFAKTVVKKYRNLDILGHVTTRRRKNYKSQVGPLPTWVPDWRDNSSSSSCLHTAEFTTIEGSRSLYQATGTSLVTMLEHSDENELLLLGLRVDAAQELLEPGPEASYGCFVDQYLAGSGIMNSPLPVGQAETSRHIYPHTGDNIRVAFLRLFTLDASVDYNGGRFNVAAHFGKLNNDNYMAQFANTIKRVKVGRIFCFTKHNRIGLVPDDTKVGDLICLLQGGSVPYILRPAGNKYIFIGECVILGLMYGEGLIERRKIVDPAYDGDDISWLDRLHNEAMPFQAETFCVK
ncbi:heterokaryon incompatibility protein-domain-containing protein [Paraphoma chrysanthemicola]|nr:heterokaryon incompatibility protein-domain-containing protein [Paraphoma chrysanthemicola]